MLQLITVIGTMIAFLNELATINQNSIGFRQPIAKTNRLENSTKESTSVDIKAILPVLAIVFSAACLFFGTQNGFYDSDDYHGNGSAH